DISRVPGPRDRLQQSTIQAFAQRLRHGFNLANKFSPWFIVRNQRASCLVRPGFLTRPLTFLPALRCRPSCQSWLRLRTFSLIQVHPDSNEVVEIPAQAKTAAGPLERLRFRCGAGIGPMHKVLARCGMRTKSKDGQIAGDKHFRCGLLIVALLEVGAGVNCVFPCPAGRREKSIESVGVGALVGIRNDLSSQAPAALAGIGDAPLDHRRVKGNFQLFHKSMNLLWRELRELAERCNTWGRRLGPAFSRDGAVDVTVWSTHKATSCHGLMDCWWE